MKYFSVLFDTFFKYRFTLLILTVFATLIAFPQLNKVQQRVSIQDFLEPSMQSTKDLEQMQFDFNSHETLVATLQKQIWTSQDLCKLEFEINNFLVNSTDVKSFSTPLQTRIAVHENKKLLFPRIIPNTCETITLNPLQLLKNSPWEVISTNSDGTDYTVFIELPKLETWGPFGRFDPLRVKKLMDGLRKINPDFQWSGNLAHEYYNYEGNQQSSTINLLAILILFVGIRAFYGTWLSALLFFSTLLFTNLFIVAGMGFVGHPMGPLEACLFLLILISTLEDFVFISSAMVNEPNVSWFNHMKNMIVPCFFTSLTTAIGFASLMISDLSMIQRFGFWASLATMLEWFILFFVMPGLFSFLKIKTWIKPEKIWFKKLVRVSQISFLNKKLIYSSFLLLLVYPVFTKFNLTQTPTEMFPPEHIFQRSLDHQKDSKGWISSGYLIFSAEMPQEKREALTAVISKDPFIYRIIGIETISAYMTSSIVDPDIKSHAQRLIERSGLGENYVTEQKDRRSVVLLKSTETKELNRIRSLVAQACPKNECRLVSEYIGFADLSQALIKTLFESLFVSLVLVALVLLYLIRKFKVKEWKALFASMLWGPLFVLSAIQFCGFTINFVTCIVASVLVGLAGDNGIQYLFAGNGLKNEGINQRSEASLICTILMAALSIVFVFSYFQPPRSLGILLSIGFIANLIGDLWVLKGLLEKTTAYK